MYTLILCQLHFNKGVKVVWVVSKVNKTYAYPYICYEPIINDSVFKDLKRTYIVSFHLWKEIEIYTSK